MLEKLSKKIKTLAFRIQLLKAICVIMLFMLSFRLYQMQVIYSEDYARFLEEDNVTRVSMNVARGRIYDRNLEVLVDNTVVRTITFMFPADGNTNAGISRMREMASKTASLLHSVDEGDRIETMVSRLRQRDLQDLWIVNNPEEANELVPQWLESHREEAIALLSEPERLEEFIEVPARLSDAEFYSIQLAAITPEMIASLTDLEKASQVIFNAMNQGIHGTINIVLNGATEREIFVIGDNLRSLPGFNVTRTSWNRAHPSEVGHMNIFGNVTTYEQGLPSNQAARLRALGYRNNDRVGTGQLEAALEPILSGINAQYEIRTENGITIENQIFEGQAGMNVSLTIDAKLQAKVDEILRDTIIRYRSNSGSSGTARYLREGYAVVLNPNTGEILSMNGIVLNVDADGNLTNESDVPLQSSRGISYWSNPLGTVHNAYTMGSTVKGATLMLGYQQGVTSIGQTRWDRRLVFPGLSFGSWRDMGSINDLTALYQSSNVYFALQTLELAGFSYQQNFMPIFGEQLHDLMELHRRFFANFGLGSSTGIELAESTGQRAAVGEGGNIFNHNIGQFDTYTTMQLAQYAMTLANGGYRFATQLVRDVFLPSNSEEDMRLHQGFAPRLLNQIEMDQRYFDRIREGFRLGVQGSQGTGTATFSNFNFGPGGAAGKTGTAESFLFTPDGSRMVYPIVEVSNVTFVGWAPVVNPEVAVAVILPQAQDSEMARNRVPNASNLGAQTIAAEAMQAFFDLREER